MGIIDTAGKLRDLGLAYESVLNDLLNGLNTYINGECIALEMEDSLFPVYSPSNLKTDAIVALPFKCEGKIGYVIVNENGIFFEDVSGQVSEIRKFKDEKI